MSCFFHGVGLFVLSLVGVRSWRDREAGVMYFAFGMGRNGVLLLPAFGRTYTALLVCGGNSCNAWVPCNFIHAIVGPTSSTVVWPDHGKAGRSCVDGRAREVFGHNVSSFDAKSMLHQWPGWPR